MAEKRIIVFASGRGSNAQALHDAMEKGEIKGRFVAAVCDNPQAPFIEKARSWGLPVIIADRKSFASQSEFERYISEEIAPYQADLICLAGFMRILSGDFIAPYENKIINIHPALLPSFKGLHGQRQAWEAGVKVAGCTVHFVVPDMDAGPIIIQETVPVKDDDTADTLAARILTKEHPSYVRAVALFCDDKLEISGNRVRIKE